MSFLAEFGSHCLVNNHSALIVAILRQWLRHLNQEIEVELEEICAAVEK